MNKKILMATMERILPICITKKGEGGEIEERGKKRILREEEMEISRDLVCEVPGEGKKELEYELLSGDHILVILFLLVLGFLGMGI